MSEAGLNFVVKCVDVKWLEASHDDEIERCGAQFLLYLHQTFLPGLNEIGKERGRQAAAGTNLAGAVFTKERASTS